MESQSSLLQYLHGRISFNDWLDGHSKQLEFTDEDCIESPQNLSIPEDQAHGKWLNALPSKGCLTDLLFIFIPKNLH